MSSEDKELKRKLVDDGERQSSSSSKTTESPSKADKKQKKSKEFVVSDSEEQGSGSSDHDEGEDSLVPKKQKNDQGEYFFTIGNPRHKKRVTVRRWKNSTLIDIREFYEDKDGDLKPGKKGISLTAEQWLDLTRIVGPVDQLIEEADK
ncbi:hypothetical protein MP228_010111 [Amoeboaphelidium protococcarum]|nr:hypothetical protein MP228_010111 [Amoeboaphelidium protococcarum]